MKPKDLRLLLSRGSSRKLFLGVVFAAPISAAIVIANGLILAEVIVGLIYNHPDKFAWTLALAGLWIFRSLFNSNFEKWSSNQAVFIKCELRREITSSFGHIESISPSVLATLLIKGANNLDIYLGRFLPQLFSSAMIPASVITSLFILDPLSAVIAIITLPLIPVFGALIGRFTNDAVVKKWKSLNLLSKYFEDSLQGFLTLRIFGRHKNQAERIQKMGDQYTQETMSVLRISFLSALVLELAATISVALIAVSIGLRLVDGQISFLHGLTVLILAPEVYFPLRNAASLFHASADGSEALSAIAAILQKKKVPTTQLEGSFDDANVFSWSEWNLNIPAVVSSTIPAGILTRGEALFIVGESGAGKSTFAEDFLGLSDRRIISIDGKELAENQIETFHRAISWIPQLPQLSPGTIRDQFLLLTSTITDREIEEILQYLLLPLSELTDGLSTKVGGLEEKSSQLSGGQLRKVAIARALIRKPILIVADEPTADLDEASAQAVMRALHRSTESGAALICITHERDFLSERDKVLHVRRSVS